MHISSGFIDTHQFQLFAITTMDKIWFYMNKIIHDNQIHPLVQNKAIQDFVSQTLKTHKDHCKAWDWKEFQDGVPHLHITTQFA